MAGTMLRITKGTGTMPAVIDGQLVFNTATKKFYLDSGTTRYLMGGEKTSTPSSLTISLNGSSQGAWDGSSAKSINIDYSYSHLTDWDFSKAYSGNYVTFDKSNPVGGPGGWINGFVTTHGSYLSSYIVNVHRTGDWYVGWGQHRDSDNMHTNPTWYKLLHSGNYTDYTVTKTGSGASGNNWAIGITGNAATASAWATARTFTIGNKAISVNGSKDLSWPLQDILLNSTSIGLTTSWDVIEPGVYYVAPGQNGSSFSGTGNPQTNTLNATALYQYGQLIVSKAGSGGLAQFYVSHQDSQDSTTYGIRFRTGWNNSYNSTWRELLDSKNYTFYTVTKTGSGATGVWNIGISGNAATSNYANSAGLLSIHNTITTNTTRSVNMSTWTGGLSGVSYMWGQAFKDTSISSDTGDLVLALRSGVYTAGGTELCVAIDGDYYSMGNKVLHAGNYNNYAPSKTGVGASGTWGINVTGSAGSVAWANITGKPSTFTPSSHNHDAGNITSGTLPIARGGTGATSDYTAYHKLFYRGGVSDANTCLKRGLYNFSTAATNIPGPASGTGSYGCIETIIANDIAEGVALGGSTSSSWVWQLGWNTSYENMYIRRSVNAGAFTAWKKMWLEGDLITGAVWNDYAEYRSGATTEPGKVVKECPDGILRITESRLEPGCEIISDTFGFAIGETDECKTPIAASGRVLAYPFEDRNTFELGQAVCSGPNGTVSKMTREEVMMYPERIIGTVSEIPQYEIWGTGNVQINGRIWIRIR